MTRQQNGKTGTRVTKLNQIVAVEKGVKAKTTAVMTEFYRVLDKSPLWAGRIRSYVPKDDDGDKFPGERQLVQAKAADVIAQLSDQLTRLFDLVYTHEVANGMATADVVVDEAVVLEDAPVTYLLFLDRQLELLLTFAQKLPVLDPEQTWSYDPFKGCYVSDEVKTLKTKKVNTPIVMYEATDKHPAQVVMGSEDVVTGTWTQVNLSGGLPYDEVAAIVRRVEKLRTAVKYARETANNADVTDYRVADSVLGYVFGAR